MLASLTSPSALCPVQVVNLFGDPFLLKIGPSETLGSLKQRVKVRDQGAGDEREVRDVLEPSEQDYVP